MVFPWPGRGETAASIVPNTWSIRVWARGLGRSDSGLRPNFESGSVKFARASSVSASSGLDVSARVDGSKAEVIDARKI